MDKVRHVHRAVFHLCSTLQYRTQRVPELIPKPTVAQLLDETTTRRVYIYGIQDDNGSDIQNFSLDLTPPPDVIMKTSPGTSEGMNVLGIVIFSATMGKRFDMEHIAHTRLNKPMVLHNSVLNAFLPHEEKVNIIINSHLLKASL